MKKVAGFHSLDLGLSFFGSRGPRLRMNFGIIDVHIDGCTIFGRLLEVDCERPCRTVGRKAAPYCDVAHLREMRRAESLAGAVAAFIISRESASKRNNCSTI